MNGFKFLLLLSIFIINSNILKSNDIHNCGSSSCKCGTYLNFTSDGREKLQRSISWENEIPKVGQKTTVSPNGIFKIHYDTTGYHAPQLIDLNKNSIPDYVDSVAFYFDYVYNVYINQLGFRSPYPDRGARGSDHYDIYLYDLGNSDDADEQNYSIGGIYGATFSSSKDFISAQPFPRMYSYIIMDNDFAATDSIRVRGQKPVQAFKYPGLPSMKVTVAHEFFHSIQFMYGISQPANITIMEMTAVAMERYFFPEVLDYLQYVRALFKNPSSYPFGFDDPTTGYGHSIFNQYLIEKHGIQIMKLIWESVASGNEVYSAIDIALKTFGSDFKSAWCEFTHWAYYTGIRSTEISYFSNANELPIIEPFSIINFNPPSVSSSGNLRPLEFRMIRFFFPAIGDITDDTLDIMMANNDVKSASSQLNIGRNYFLQTSDSQIIGSDKIDNLDYWLYKELNSDFICSSNYISSGGKTVEIGHPYPNPVRISTDKYVLFPAPAESEIYSKVLLVIYDSEMRTVFSEQLSVTVNNNFRVLMWDKIPTGISSGTYIYGVHNGDDIIIGKFAIIND